MTFFELVLLAFGLCFDTFAVSIGGGIQTPFMETKHKLKVILIFGSFQAAFLFAGWLAGNFLSGVINRWDHWIAFAILSYLGIKMVIEGFSKKEDMETADFLSVKRLALLAVATSIDAVAVGVSLAFIMLPVIKVSFVVLVTGLLTASVSYIGIKWGQKLGRRIGQKAEILGGVILFAIGVKILVEHLFF